MKDRPSYKVTFFDRHGPDGVLRIRAAAYALGVLGTILGYEVPKYDGELGQPNVFVPVAADFALRARRLRQKAAPLVISDGFHPYSGCFRERSDRIRFFRLIPYHGTDAI